jgi:hypothetical protein
MGEGEEREGQGFMSIGNCLIDNKQTTEEGLLMMQSLLEVTYIMSGMD